MTDLAISILAGVVGGDGGSDLGSGTGIVEARAAARASPNEVDNPAVLARSVAPDATRARKLRSGW
jgi:hypothetical protein